MTATIKITKREIANEIKTTRNGIRICHHFNYDSEDGGGYYFLETHLFSPAGNQNRVINESGSCVSGIMNTKKEFINFISENIPNNIRR